MMLLLTLLITFVNSNYINRLNRMRTNYNIPKVEYNNELHQKLKEFSKDNEYYKFGNKSSNFTTPNGQIRINRLIGSFYEFQNNNETYTYMFRDTMKKGRINTIMNMRINQRKCLNWKRCRGIFNNYVSCLKPNRINFQDLHKCSYAHAYLPVLLEKSFTKFACVELATQGLYVPKKQKNTHKFSFWCYSNHKKRMFDNPFLN